MSGGRSGDPDPTTVYLPVTWSGLAEVVAHGLPVGTTGYAATAALRQALGVAAGAEDEGPADVALDAAAEASLIALGAAASSGAGATPGAVHRRAVLVCDLPTAAATGEGGDHPAAVVLAVDLAWGDVRAVMADDVGAETVVARAVVLLGTDHEAAVAATDDLDLGWFDPSELG